MSVSRNKETLQLIDEGVYNFARSSLFIFKELTEVILYLHKRLLELEKAERER